MSVQQVNIDFDLLIKWLGQKELEMFFLQQQLEILRKANESFASEAKINKGKEENQDAAHQERAEDIG